MIHKRVRILVSGVVQGVGFRPFVFNLALKYGIKGFVLNNSSGVLIDAEGAEDDLESFIEEIKSAPPKSSIIEDIEIECSCEPLYRKEFIIKNSEQEASGCTMLPTDRAICPECLREMRSKENKRYSYPFINCIDCGPRYTIIKALPYDRDRTSMDSFVMCDSCKVEYENPIDRRFHAEPISCQACGPKLTLYRKNGSTVIDGLKSIEIAAKAIKKGEIVAIKGMGGFHLVCDASKANVVKRLRDKKNRPSKPFAVMFAAFSDILKCAEIDELERELINSSERPIVLVQKRKPHRLEKFCIACDYLAPNNPRMGVFLPYTPLHILLMDRLHSPVVCTSANVSDEAIITSKEKIFERLSDVVDYVLDYDREIVNPVDDSVVSVVDRKPVMIRRARGYAPVNIRSSVKSNLKILALGASQKSAIAVSFDENTLLSPHIGDIDNLDTFEYFKKTVELFMGLYGFTPEAVAYDMHPAYRSVKFAKTLGLKGIGVYHHHAHILSLLGEHNIPQKRVLGIAWDGSGYGEDGTIWGGEFLEVEGVSFRRVGHLKPFKLLGGEAAIKEPSRVAFSLLYGYFGDKYLDIFDEDTTLLKKMQDSSLNAVTTTSVGRLFDAVAFIAGLIVKSSYDGEAGVCIENLVDRGRTDSYDFDVEEGVVDISSMLEGMMVDRLGDTEGLCSKFINTLAKVALSFAKSSTLPAALSGGVFQNQALLYAIKREFEKEGIEYYTHSKIPANDGGIAYGQCVYVALSAQE